MSNETGSIFTYEVLNQLSQLPKGSVIDIDTDVINVFNDSRDFEDYVPSHKFKRTIMWVDEKGE